MFPRHQRLTAGQIKEIFGSIKPKYFTFFKLYRADSPDNSFKVSTIVSKNVVKKAYARNRVRRRIYNALREVLKNRPTLDDLSYEELLSALDGAIN